MLRLIHPINARPAHQQLSRSCRLKLEVSFWIGMIVIFWETLLPFRTSFGAEPSYLAEWVALGLAGIATVTALQIKRSLRRKLDDKKNKPPPRLPEPGDLIDLLRKHGVREFGSMYLYMPMPKQTEHSRAWSSLEALHAGGLIKGGPWHINAGHIRQPIRDNHPDLFARAPKHFDVYRLDWQLLLQMMGGDIA